MFLFDGYGLVPYSDGETSIANFDSLTEEKNLCGKLFDFASTKDMVCQPYMIKYMLPLEKTELREVTIKRYELYNTEVEAKDDKVEKNVFDHINSALISR
jgi:hypothetical protein